MNYLLEQKVIAIEDPSGQVTKSSETPQIQQIQSIVTENGSEPKRQLQPMESMKMEEDFRDGYEEDSDDEADDQNYAVAEVSPKGRFFRFKDVLGRGAYKVVYKGLDNETACEIAWNVISLINLPESDKTRIKTEINLFKSLKHKNILHFISGWQNKDKQEVVFITEMITGGTLRDYIKKNNICKLRVIKQYCIEILKGLCYLHEFQPKPIIHRDLKCENIFINSNNADIRIGDLGLSTPMEKSYTASVLGTPNYMAPEVFEEHYDTAVDIYAFGMCVLEMVTQEKPYSECTSHGQIIRKVIGGEPPEALERIKDPEVLEFILVCLNQRKEMRPTARQLLNSPFLQDLKDGKNSEILHVTKAKKRPMKKNSSYIHSMATHDPIPDDELNEESEDEPGSGTTAQFDGSTLAKDTNDKSEEQTSASFQSLSVTKDKDLQLKDNRSPSFGIQRIEELKEAPMLRKFSFTGPVSSPNLEDGNRSFQEDSFG